MKSNVILILLICLATPIQAQWLTVATYNMRYSIKENHMKDSVKGESWKDRGPVIGAMLRFHELDIIGSQECRLHQLQDLDNMLPEYRYLGIGRDDGKQGGEFTAIFYRHDRFRVLDRGDFWLSETPDKPSMGWDGNCCHRICTWASLEDLETQRQFFVFNTHFDHQGILARKESSKLVIRKMKEIAGNSPVIFMGDLNGDRSSEWYRRIEETEMLMDTYHHAGIVYAPNGSFNGFGRSTASKRVIDHVFITRHFRALKWGILTDTYHGRFPSDHFPVMVKLILRD
jgi:endonuclease/exonuclease/phosphatase family metal-dependent hydrolase